MFTDEQREAMLEMVQVCRRLTDRMATGGEPQLLVTKAMNDFLNRVEDICAECAGMSIN